MTPEQAVAETGDGNTSAMVEIGWVNLQFAAVRCGMVPFGANLPTHHLNASVNRRFGVLFVCCCVATGGYRSG